MQSAQRQGRSPCKRREYRCCYGKGIALMFKEMFPANFRAHEAACKAEQLHVGRMFVTETRRPKVRAGSSISRPGWRQPSKLEWIIDGLKDLGRVISENNIRSVALPALGCGNGTLNWCHVRREIERALSNLENFDIYVYESTAKYHYVRGRAT